MREKKNLSGMKLKYWFEIRDSKTGKLLKRTRKRNCRSFVIGFMKHLEFVLAHAYGTTPDPVSTPDSTGSSQTISNNNVSNTCACEAPGNDSSYGILVGTGTTAVTTSDYAVETQITHGSGGGQLNHGACVVGGAVDAGSGCTLTISRQFGNASGSQITIRELCLCSKTYSNKVYLLSRDIVTQAVDNGNTATAIIEISTTL
jgi:hypothetical protein